MFASSTLFIKNCHRVNDRLATIRPLGERSEPLLAAKQSTTSDEVARGRLVSLEGFAFAFRAKNGKWRDSHLGFQVSCVSPSLKEQICLLCAKVDEFRRLEKYKNLFQSRVNTGKGDFTTKESLTSAHILNLQRLFNTCIYLPVTLTGSEKVS